MATLQEKAQVALRMVREAPIIVYDTETTGVDWKVNQPVGHVIATPDKSVYVPIRHGGGGNLMDPTGKCAPMAAAEGKTIQHPFEADLAEAFADRQMNGVGPVVSHNTKFDAHMGANVGIYLGRDLQDTQINQVLIDEFSPGFSLDACAQYHGVSSKFLAVYAHIAQTLGVPNDRNIMAHFWRMPGNDPQVVEYAEADGIVTHAVRDKQMGFIQHQGLDQIWRIESELIWTVFRMERRGIRVDVEGLHAMHEAIGRRYGRAIDKLPQGLNVRSGVQIKKWMEELGFTDWPLTDKGSPSFTEKWLTRYPEGRAVIECRKLSNLSNSFIRPLIEEHMFEGRVHSSLNQLKSDEYGTISGRFSSSKPNMQQIPKRDKDLGSVFRKAFIADEGFTFFEADYSQCEPRLFAHYSGEPRLVEGYTSFPPKDMHAVVAEMFDVDRAVTAKRMNMGILTGMYPKAFAQHMEWPLDEATRAWNEWFENFPAIRDFQGNATRLFSERGWVKTILGRKLRLENKRFAYRAVSRIIQGSNADIVKERLLTLDKAFEADGDRDQLLMTVHDSVVGQTEFDGDETERMARIINIVHAMEDVQGPPYNLRVPFKVDLGIGPNWSVATYGEPDAKQP